MPNEHFEALKRLYVEYKCASEQVSLAIADKDYNEVQNVVRRKGEILKHIINQEKIVEYDDDMRLEQAAIKSEIAKIEEQNIANLNQARSEVKSELARVNKNTNLHKAYAINTGNTGDIINTLE